MLIVFCQLAGVVGFTAASLSLKVILYVRFIRHDIKGFSKLL